MLKPEDYSIEDLQKKKEEAERKARRGEIDPIQEFTFQILSKVNTSIYPSYFKARLLTININS